MNINLTKLINGLETEIKFKNTIIFEEKELLKTDIKKLSPISAKGVIRKISDGVYNLSLEITGTMTLQCSLSLENIDYPIHILVKKDIEESENEEEYYKISGNTLDIMSIIWENIVLEVPLRVVKENATIEKEGVGWEVIDEGEETKATESLFQELKDKLDMEGK